MKMALGNEKISISENIVKVVGAKEFKVRRVNNCKLLNLWNKSAQNSPEFFLLRMRLWLSVDVDTDPLHNPCFLSANQRQLFLIVGSLFLFFQGDSFGF